MPFVPKSVRQQSKQSKPSNRSGSDAAPPPMEAVRHQTERSLEDLFERLHELRAYLAATEAPLRAPEDQEAYRPTEPEYYGSDGVQHSVRRIYEDTMPKRDKMTTDIFGASSSR